jgi:hypothetical protein
VQETLDRLLLEPNIAWAQSGDSRSALESGLTLVTYLQRFARAVTTLAVVGTASEVAVRRVEAVAARLQELSRSMIVDEPVQASYDEPARAAAMSLEFDVAERQLWRMERQVGVMERAAAALQLPASMIERDPRIRASGGGS